MMLSWVLETFGVGLRQRSMRGYLLFSVFIVSVFLFGCKSEPAISEAGVAGAYTGTGKFVASAGSMDVKVQLETDEDGAYRMLFLEPAPLALFGMEEGTWVQEGETVVLTPVKKEASKDGGVFSQLSAASSQSAVAKSLVVDGSELVWSDGKMDVRFARK